MPRLHRHLSCSIPSSNSRIVITERLRRLRALSGLLPDDGIRNCTSIYHCAFTNLVRFNGRGFLLFTHERRTHAKPLRRVALAPARVLGAGGWVVREPVWDLRVSLPHVVSHESKSSTERRGVGAECEWAWAIHVLAAGWILCGSIWTKEHAGDRDNGARGGGVRVVLCAF